MSPRFNDADVRKMVLLVTDGMCVRRVVLLDIDRDTRSATLHLSRHNVRDSDPLAAAEALRARHIDVFVLAIGDYVDDRELVAYAGGRADRLMKTDLASVPLVGPNVAAVLLQ